MAGLALGPGAIAQGALLVGALFGVHPRTTCECVCSGSADERILSILEQQLLRCGPERLAPAVAPAVAPAAASAVAPWWLILGVLLLAVVLGAALGAAFVIRLRRPGDQPGPLAVEPADTSCGRRSPVTPSVLRGLNDVRL